MEIDKEKLILVGKKACAVLKDGSREGFEQTIQNHCDEARKLQKEDDIIIFVMALSDYGKKEEDIYEALSKYWNIDSRREASEYIHQGRHIEWPINKLKIYLRKSGIKVSVYMKENHVREKLANNPNLCTLSGEKLKAALEKK